MANSVRARDFYNSISWGEGSSVQSRDSNNSISWGGGVPMLGRPTNLDYSRARAYCACSRCGWGLFGHFFFRVSFLFSTFFSL